MSRTCPVPSFLRCCPGGPGGIFVERARETLRDWRAEPARVNGTPVVADTHVVFAFKK